MDHTLRAILSELYACSAELDKLRQRVAELEVKELSSDGPPVQPH